MNEFPKLVIFSNTAIPRVKSTYKGATVDTYDLRKLAVDSNKPITQLLSISQYFDDTHRKKAIVISGITEEQLTFFNLSNASYPTLKVEKEDDYVILPALEDALYFLQNRYQALGEFENATSAIFDIFKFLDVVNLNKMRKKNDAVVDKAEDGSADIHYTLEAWFFSWFNVHVP
jgi:hypothetical protein